MFKFFVISLICLVVVANAAIDKETVMQIREALHKKIESCAHEVKASPDDVAVIMDKKIPSTHEGKCIFFCLHKQFNAQNADGSLNLDGALDSLSFIKDMDADYYEKVVNIFKKCAAIPNDADPCVYASSLVDCIMKEGMAAGLSETIVE